MRSILQDVGGNAHECGYCGSKEDTFVSTGGIWAHRLTPADYQALIDRGFRRSGAYLYKPDLATSCCQPYTIRLDATAFAPTKSQKKVRRRVAAFLRTGLRPGDRMMDDRAADDHAMTRVEAPAPAPAAGPAPAPTPAQAPARAPPGPEQPRPALGKKREWRKQRKLAKLAASSTAPPAAAPPEPSRPPLPTIELENDPENKVRLTVTPVVPTVTAEAFALYKKYQVAVHKDKPESLDEQQYKRFLVDSPIKTDDSERFAGQQFGLGSYHFEYRLDGALVAVSVVDVLPQCLSSVYLFYDPDHDFLSLGKYSALREIDCIRQLGRKDLIFYYMGFYIQSCQKMRYKGEYRPSALLCPETYTWVPLDDAIVAKVDARSLRLAPASAPSLPEPSIDDTVVIVKQTLVRFGALPAQVREALAPGVRDYVGLVGEVAGRAALAITL